MKLPKYSIGIGDRFAHQGTAQLDAMILAQRQGVEVAPVWNKSFREHSIVGSSPADVRNEADRAVADRGWTAPYFVDADHISLKTVDLFLDSSDFFTLDVADKIGQPAEPQAISQFVARHKDLVGSHDVPGLDKPLEITESLLTGAAEKFLAAVQEAGKIYRHIEAAKGPNDAVVEVSMDETDRPQTPGELLIILAAVADEKIPAATLAPRFSGEFLKGIDYVGDVDEFTAEFQADLAVVALAVEKFGLPDELKLSIHSGSDKFSLYPRIREALGKFNAGVHLKTAGTTWLEELIGLAAAGGEGLAIAKEIYAASLARFDELCVPYASVIDIQRPALPTLETVQAWDADRFAAALRHDETCESYDPNVRQLLHVGYRVAAEMGERFTAALEQHAEAIAAGVTENLYARHLRPLLVGR